MKGAILKQLIFGTAGVVLLGIAIFVLLPNVLSVFSNELVKVLHVNSKNAPHFEENPSDAQGMTESNSQNESGRISMINLPGYENSQVGSGNIQSKDKLTFNEWYKTPQECLASADNPEPDLIECVNRRIRARREYMAVIKNRK